jgi:hypothetical protein
MAAEGLCVLLVAVIETALQHVAWQIDTVSCRSVPLMLGLLPSDNK